MILARLYLCMITKDRSKAAASREVASLISFFASISLMIIAIILHLHNPYSLTVPPTFSALSYYAAFFLRLQDAMLIEMAFPTYIHAGLFSYKAKLACMNVPKS